MIAGNESPTDAAAAVRIAYETEWARIVATLIRITGDWSLAEDCAQDAFERAVIRWPGDGVPRNPGAWLVTVAKNRALDRLRRSANEATKLREVAVMRELEPDESAESAEREDAGLDDDRLRLIFTCCHPALSLEARVALTLRTVAGLTTAEIGRAFLASENTMSQRLLRAKRKIADAGIPYRVPSADLLPGRLVGVLVVLYLLFNEGYSASSGERLVRDGLANEAIRITRMLVRLMPEQPEVSSLLALMLLQHSRRNARVDGRGNLRTLEEQDRSLWDRAAIEEAVTLLEGMGATDDHGVYGLQAMIAACHATASSSQATDFRRIATLYDELAVLHPSPVIELNRAIAWGMAAGPETGLERVNRVASSDALAGYYLLPAAQADFLRRLGRTEEAAERYRESAALAPTEPERRYLERRLRELES